MSKLSRTVRASTKRGSSIPAVIVDIISSTRASARLAGQGAVYRNLLVIGGPAELGDFCHVDMTTQEPTIVMVGKTWLTENDVSKLLQKIPTGSGAGSILDLDKIWVFGESYGLLSFGRDSGGLTSALDACSSGYKVIVPNGIFTNNYTVPSGVYLTGMGPTTIITGQVTLSGGSCLDAVKINRTTSDSETTVGVSVSGSTEALIRSCRVHCTQNGTGDSYAVSHTGEGDLEIWDSYISATAMSGNGYGSYHSSSGDMYIYNSRIAGSTSPLETIGE